MPDPARGAVDQHLAAEQSPPWRSACSAVRPATGNVAAWASLTASGKAATAWVRQLTRSAQAPDGRMPTTRVPGSGPLPSAAAVSTTPAKSQPGRQPGSAPGQGAPRFAAVERNRGHPHRDLVAVGIAQADRRMASLPGTDGSTTTARICCGIVLSS